MFTTANQATVNLEDMARSPCNRQRHSEYLTWPQFLGLDAELLWETTVCVLSTMLILSWLLYRWRKRVGETEEEDSEDSDIDVLKDFKTQTFTVYNNCLQRLDALEVLMINSGGNGQKLYPDSHHSQGENSDSSDSLYDIPVVHENSTIHRCVSKRKPSPHRYLVQLPDNCKQCRSVHFCSNDGGRCLNVRVQSGNDTLSSGGEESLCEWCQCSASPDSTSTFTTVSPISSTASSMPPLESDTCQMDQANHVSPVTPTSRPFSRELGETTGEETGFYNPLLTGYHWKQTLGVNIRKRIVCRLWRRAILLVRIVIMLLPERLRQKTSPERALTGAENLPHTEANSVSGSAHFSNNKTDFESKRAYFERGGPILTEGKSVGKRSKVTVIKFSPVCYGHKTEKQETRVSSTPREYLDFKCFKVFSKIPGTTHHSGQTFPPPKRSRSFLIRLIGPEVTNQLEINLKQKRLQHQLAWPTFYTESLEKMAAQTTPAIISVRPQSLELKGVETPFISHEWRGTLESHIKLRVIQHQWGLPKLVSQSLKEFMVKPAKSKDTRQDKIVENTTKTEPQPCITDQPCKEEDYKPMTFKLGQGAKDKQLQSEVADKTSSALVHDIKTGNVPIKETGRYTTVKEITLCTNSSVAMEQKRACLDIKLAQRPNMKEGTDEVAFPLPKSPVKKPIEPGMCILLSRVKNVIFMKEEALNLIGMNLKQKHLEHQLGADTIFTQSLELMTPKVPNQPKQMTSQEVELDLNGADMPFLSKEIRDMLEFHIKLKKMQHRWGLPRVGQRSLNAFIPKAPKVNQSRIFPKPLYAIQVLTCDLPFLTEEQRETLENNVKKKKAHKNWGYPKRIMDSLKAFQLPEGVAKDLKKKCQPRTSVQSLSEPSTDGHVETTNHKTTTPSTCLSSEKNKEPVNQNNSHSLQCPEVTKDRACPNVAYGPFLEEYITPGCPPISSHKEKPRDDVDILTSPHPRSHLKPQVLQKGSRVHGEVAEEFVPPRCQYICGVWKKNTEKDGGVGMKVKVSPSSEQVACSSENSHPPVDWRKNVRVEGHMFISYSAN